MPLVDRQILLCSCNGAISVDAAALAGALGLPGPLQVRTQLCRREAACFGTAVSSGKPALVACTQEAALFRELAVEAGGSGELRFVNLRELAGRTRDGTTSQAGIAAALAMASVPEPEPVAAVSVRSAGATAILGPLDAALGWAERLKERLDVTVLATALAGGTLSGRRDYPVRTAAGPGIAGHMGAFELSWEQPNPIDLELCTRCNACVRACPEGAIGFAYQIDLDRCRAHRDCVAACGAVGAIDFSRARGRRSERFDLVLDLGAEPLIRRPHPPEGYFAPGRDPLDQAQAVIDLLGCTGEFEKPTYASVDARLCAHSRNSITGCTRCLDVCSAQAIAAHGDAVKLDAHLCAGCGGCATVCPTGAIRHQYPRAADIGLRLKRGLAAFRRAGGMGACVMFHAAGDEGLLMELGQRGGALPAHVIPLAVHEVASVGLELMLGALAYGAGRCVILAPEREAEGYLEASRRQIEIGERILQGLGYGGKRLGLMVARDWKDLEVRLGALEVAEAPGQSAVFDLAADKRTALEFVIDHLAGQAPQHPREVALPADSPWGSVELDREKCTLCMACAGACPASALMATAEAPRLRFIERNCVQCGLCVATCPEDALALVPRLSFGTQSRRERVLNEAEPALCVRCGKPFGTKQMLDAMTARLSGHAMFAGESARRLQMCADCRVADIIEQPGELTVFELPQ